MGSIRTALQYVVLGAVCTFGVAASVSAQSTGSGDIRGVVTDATGALMPDVTVTIVNNDTGVTKVLTTNHDGLYDTAAIVIGNYSVTFEKDWICTVRALVDHAGGGYVDGERGTQDRFDQG